MIHNELSKIDLSKGYSGGGVVGLNSDKDPTDQDGDIGMCDSTGERASEAKRSLVKSSEKLGEVFPGEAGK
ncbi:hypothetical protein Tco_0517761 [Tanacetum coccineum]